MPRRSPPAIPPAADAIDQPHCSASSAENGLPDRINSLARRSPTARGRILGAAAARHDAERHFGQREARMWCRHRRSRALPRFRSRRHRPAPLIAPITGIGQPSKARSHPLEDHDAVRCQASSVMPLRSLRSPPAQNALSPLPVRITARTSAHLRSRSPRTVPPGRGPSGCSSHWTLPAGAT